MYQTGFRHYYKTKSKGSISHNKIFDFYEDSDNDLWIGTEGGGINYLPYNQEKNYKTGFTSYDICPPGEQNFVHDIIELNKDGKKIMWVGTGYNSVLVELRHDGKDWTVRDIMPEISYNFV